jgi:hypothetical protein
MEDAMKRLSTALALGLLGSLPTAAFAGERQDAEVALEHARTSVQAAEHADAGQTVPTEFHIAQDSLAAAEGAYDRHHWVETIYASERASADADLATARARQQRMEAATAELETTVETLRREVGQGG